MKPSTVRTFCTADFMSSLHSIIVKYTSVKDNHVWRPTKQNATDTLLNKPEIVNGFAAVWSELASMASSSVSLLTPVAEVAIPSVDLVPVAVLASVKLASVGVLVLASSSGRTHACFCRTGSGGYTRICGSCGYTF